MATGATVLAASRDVQVVERRDREWQAIHWACQTAHMAHPDTCAPDVLEWLSQPLVPGDRLDTIPLLSFSAAR